MKKEDLLNHTAVVVSWSFSDLIDKKGTLLIGMVDRKGQSTVVNAFTDEDALALRDLLLDGSERYLKEGETNGKRSVR